MPHHPDDDFHHPTSPPAPTDPADPFGALGPYGRPAPTRRSFPGEAAAWAVIIAITLIVAGFNFYAAYFAPPPAPAAPGQPAITAETHNELTLHVISRHLVGADHLLSGVAGGTSVDAAQVRTQIEPFLEDDASEFDRVRAAIVLGELVGPDAAIEELDRLDAHHLVKPFTDPETATDIQHLRDLYAQGQAALTPSDRDRLIKRHAWFGRLASGYNQPDTDADRAASISKAKRTTITLIGAFIIVAVAGLVGLVLMIVGIVMLASGRLRPALGAQLEEVSDPRLSPYAGVLACFLLLFTAISFAADLIPTVGGVNVGIFTLWLALAAAFWPHIRGTSLRDLRTSLGWHTGRGVLREIGAGIVGYLALLPIAALGVLLVFILTIIGGVVGLEPQGHPAAEQISADPKKMIPLLILGCVWAPVVEETVFRGAFHRYLRGVMPPVLGALVQGFFFAIIHPQGLIAVPALMALGFNFAMIREWRGSLIGPITAHALNNGFVFTMLFIAIS